jgi:hypothetical protein
LTTKLKTSSAHLESSKTDQYLPIFPATAQPKLEMPTVQTCNPRNRGQRRRRDARQPISFVFETTSLTWSCFHDQDPCACQSWTVTGITQGVSNSIVY